MLLQACVCFVCEKPLTGSLDTFGDKDRPVCQSCFLSCAQTEEEAEQEETRRIMALHGELEELQFDLSELCFEIKQLEPQLKALRKEQKEKQIRLKEIMLELEIWEGTIL